VLLEEFKHIYGYDPDAELDDGGSSEIIQQIKADKTLVETRSRSIKSSLIKDLSGLFQPQGDTYLAYVEAIGSWYTNLHPDQKILTADWQSPSSRALLEAVQKLQDVEKTFLEVIPAAYGFKPGKGG